MPLYLLYRPNSEDEREVREFLHALDMKKIEIEKVDMDTVEGQRMVELYDAVRHPAVIATKGDGTLQQMWMDKMPTINDIQFYNH